MDKIKFTMIVQWVTFCLRSKDYFEGNELSKLDQLMTDAVQPEAVAINVNDLNNLLALMQAGDRKIDAIRTYRAITGQGLKEAKDAVEKYWPTV